MRSEKIHLRTAALALSTAAFCACQSTRSGPAAKAEGVPTSLSLGDGVYQRAHAIAETQGGGWVLAGLRTDAAGADLDGPHPYLLRVDAEGALLWDVALHDDPDGNDRPDGELHDVVLSLDGARVLACGGAQAADGFWRAQVFAFSLDGALLVEHLDPGTGDDGLPWNGFWNGIAPLPDGGCVVAGAVTGGFPVSGEIVVARYDAALSPVWRTVVAADADRWGADVFVTKEGLVVVAGHDGSDPDELEGMTVLLQLDGSVTSEFVHATPGTQNVTAMASGYRETDVPRWAEVSAIMAGSAFGMPSAIEAVAPVVRLVDLDGSVEWELSLAPGGGHAEVHGVSVLTNEGVTCVGLVADGVLAYDSRDGAVWRVGAYGEPQGEPLVLGGPYQDVLADVSGRAAAGWTAAAPGGAGSQVWLVILEE